MINTYKEFIKKQPKYVCFSNNDTAENVFDFLSDIENINKMIISCNNDRPALAGCIYDLECRYANDKQFNFQDRHVKQCIGSMVKFILEPFGYESLKSKRMPKSQTKFFSSAKVYSFNKDKAELTIINNLRIEVINNEK